MNNRERLFSDYGSMKERLIIQMVNYERNKQELQGKAYVPYLDLAVLFCIEERRKGGTVLLPLPEKILAGQSADQVMHDAVRRMQEKYPAVIYDMKEWLMEKITLAGLQEEFQGMAEIPQNERQYYLTDREEAFGAVTMLYSGVLHNFAERLGAGELILLASSRGTVVIPKLEGRGDDLQKWQRMQADFVRDSGEDFLTDNVYLYRADADNISIWKK